MNSLEMDKQYLLNLYHISNDPKLATKNVADILFNHICPLMFNIRNKVQKYDGPLSEDEISKFQDVYALCASQIKKSLLSLFDVFKTEYINKSILQDSRQCTLERLSWCINRLNCIKQKLDITETDTIEEGVNDSMVATTMYFVNWIDHTFELLSKLSQVIYKTDYKDTSELYEKWKNDVVECVATLHLSLDELLLSAMTLCKYCLPSDQHIVKARCQVVLRESKALISELIDGDLDKGFKVTKESLKLPIMPSNVNVLIDVLKDVLYVLETNTNTALLALVVHCFSYSISPVNVLKNHFLNTNGTCSCYIKNDGESTEDCSFVKAFDLYNERLLQIGSFAVSCSSDQGRILCLRSGLASMEALDPHLVPALMMSPNSHHANFLVDTWSQEVQEIRDSIFLIVDPAAYAEKTKQMMHQQLLELLKKSSYDNGGVCSVINTGCVAADFFRVYTEREPGALAHHDSLVPLLEDLDKVQMECKVVSNLFCSGDDYVYDVQQCKNKKVTLEQLIKRLKLLYTLVSRINALLHPKDNEELFDCEGEQEAPINVTHTVHKNILTYVQSPRKPANMSRSIFARTTNLRSSTNKFPLQKLTKHLRSKMRDELSFSTQLDEMFNLSEVKSNRTTKLATNKHFDSVREPGVLYNFSSKNRGSLRKAVLSRHCKLPLEMDLIKTSDIAVENSRALNESLVDEATSLQITDILNEMNDMTKAFSKVRIRQDNVTEPKHGFTNKTSTYSNVLRININTTNNETITKHVWSIPVTSETDDSTATSACNVTGVSNITAPSNVTTLERITDIEFLESKLNSLKTLEETSL